MSIALGSVLAGGTAVGQPGTSSSLQAAGGASSGQVMASQSWHQHKARKILWNDIN